MRKRRLLVEDCFRLRLADLRREGPRGKFRVRGLGTISYEIVTRGVADPRRHVCLTFPDGHVQKIRIVERPMPHAIGGGRHPTRWEFDLGTRQLLALYLAPGDTHFRSRVATGAKHASNAMNRRPLERFRKEQCLARYPLDVQLGVRPPKVPRKEWEKIKRLFGLAEEGADRRG
jgi:hypothetical protein